MMVMLWKFLFFIMFKSKLLETHVRAQVIYKKTAPDGEVESIVQKELTVSIVKKQAKSYNVSHK